MATKKQNRKKALKRKLALLKKAGRERFEQVMEATETVVEKAVEQVKEVVSDLKDKEPVEEVKEAVSDLKDKEPVEEVKEAVSDLTESEPVEQAKEAVSDLKEKAALSLEDFQALKEFDGIAANRLETFYQAGIQKVEDFSDWSEEALLELKGIGAATIKQLKEKGIALKNGN